MTAIPIDQIARPEPRRDRTGRYLITPPGNNHKPIGYTRATTIAATLEDTYRLGRWEQRQIAYGLGLRPDLVDLAAGHNPDDHRSTYENIINEAGTAARKAAAANRGTALHRFTEQLDRGDITIDQAPTHYQPHLTNYTARLDQAGFIVEPALIELIVALDTYRIAGQLDRGVRATQAHHIHFPNGRTTRIEPGELIVGDLKTGNLDWSHLKFGSQISIYANHDATWHPDDQHPAGGTRGPRIDVNRDVALVIHLPAKDPDGPCELHWVDLAGGWDATLCALEAREHRRTAKKLYARFDDNETLTAEATAWIRRRVQDLAGHAPAVTDLRNRWPADLPQPFPERPTPEQILALAAVLDRVEARHEIPFGDPQPPLPTGDTPT